MPERDGTNRILSDFGFTRQQYDQLLEARQGLAWEPGRKLSEQKRGLARHMLEPHDGHWVLSLFGVQIMDIVARLLRDEVPASVK